MLNVIIAHYIRWFSTTTSCFWQEKGGPDTVEVCVWSRILDTVYPYYSNPSPGVPASGWRCVFCYIAWLAAYNAWFRIHSHPQWDTLWESFRRSKKVIEQAVTTGILARWYSADRFVSSVGCCIFPSCIEDHRLLLDSPRKRKFNVETTDVLTRLVTRFGNT